jgi:hypothetical protein
VSVKFFDNNRPESRLSIVVFPQPDGPTIAVNVLGENIPLHLLRMVLPTFTLLVFPVTGSLTFYLTSATTFKFLNVSSNRSTGLKANYRLVASYI